MMHPILLLGLAVGAGLAWTKRSAAAATPATTDAALIDFSEKSHPNAETARKAILNSMRVNSLTLYEMTAVAIETQLRMPKTAANLRTWATMAKQGGNAIAGEFGYGDDGDEVGARRRRRPKQLAAATSPTKKRRRRRRARSAIVPELAAAAAVPTVENVLAAARAEEAPSYARSYGYGASDWGDEGEDEEEGDEDEDEVGAARSKELPEWLRFSATQSKLAGDPKLIRATALLMRRMGYVRHSEIHLQLALGALR